MDWIERAHCRMGYATEASAVLTTGALSLEGIERVEIHHDKANVASAGIPRRLGYRFVCERRDDDPAPGGVGIEWVWRMER